MAPFIETYTGQQKERVIELDSLIMHGNFDPDEYQKIRNLDVEPKHYFAAVEEFIAEIYNSEVWTKLPSQSERGFENLDPFFQDLSEKGYGFVNRVGNTIVASRPAWECTFCPCCMAEEDPRGEIPQPEDAIAPAFILGESFIIRDVRTEKVVYTDAVGLHMATEHHCSAGLDVETMIGILDLNQKDTLHS